MKPPFRIVPDSIPEDIDGCLSELYRHRKDLIGFAFVAMYKNRRIAVNGAGEAIRNPIFARGTVASLDGRGLWGDPAPIPPWEWRKAKR